MNAPSLRPGPFVNQRRSQRILLSVPVMISGQKPSGAPFSERTRTLVVNAHGALVELREPVLAGQPLRIKNLGTNEEITCKVADINPGRSNLPEVGAEFAQEYSHFWRVAFPPADWSPHNAEAKRPARIPAPSVPMPVKK